jgi:hypothetical protein
MSGKCAVRLGRVATKKKVKVWILFTPGGGEEGGKVKINNLYCNF